MLTLTVGEDIKKGDSIMMTRDQLIAWRWRFGNQAIGLANRNIKTGEQIEFESGGNTEDILTRLSEEQGDEFQKLKKD